MSAPAPATAPGPDTGRAGRRHAAGPRKTWSDTLVLARRNLRHMARDPFEPAIALTMPVTMLLLFGFVFGEAMAPPGAEDYPSFLVPAMLAMVMVYGIAGTAAGVARDTAREVMGRFRSMPMAPIALLGARVLSDMLRGAVEIVLLLGVGLLLGWRAEDGVVPAAGAVGVLLLFRLALVCLGALLGLVMPTPDSVSMVVYPLAFPLTMLSTSFLPAQAMPAGLAPVAEWNPLSAVVTATRELFGNPALPSDAWPAQHAPALAVAVSTAIVLVSAPLAVRRFRSLDR